MKATRRKFRFIVLGITFSLVLAAIPAWADGETGTVTGWQPGATVTGTLNGESFSNWGGTIHMELAGGTTVAVFCTDIPHHVGVGDTFVASDEEMDCRVKWLLTHYPPRMNDYEPWPDGAPGALSNRNQEIAARQAAVWHFSDGLDPDDTTTVGARAWDIINVVPEDACAADAPNITITPASTVNPINTTQTFTVTVTRGGAPVSDQAVALTADHGMLSTDAVTTDDQGQATFTLTHDTPDVTSNVNASAEMTLPVGTIFVGTEPNKQKLVLGEETLGSVHGSATATWTGTGSVTTISFDDYNMNGEHDAGEPLLEGWTITLYKDNAGSWDLVDTETTDGTGTASFTGLSAGTYRAVETIELDDWYNTTDVDIEFTLADDESQSFIFGQIKLPVIIGHVFQDDDADGTHDASESPLEGWDLRLYREGGSFVVGMQGTTGGNGQVIFSSHPDRNPPDILPGSYYVQETLQDEWYATTGISQTVTVSSGDIGHTWLGNTQEIPDPDEEEDTDTDGDGIPDYLDDDDDGDTIPDETEGTGDADGDGVPNYLDLDSDGDTIPDAVEGAGDADGDGTPNFLDLDSDGDTIPDAVEGAGDADGDGTPNFLDLDSDGDGIPDEVETADDADGDGTPNFLDLDSDGDGIPDEVETADDADGDGTPNFLDLDSDGDGLLDSQEWSTGADDPLAGCTADDPVCFDNDADGDGIPNYLDTDSDDDDISDGEEGLQDGDEDGVPDWLDPNPDAETEPPFHIYLPLMWASGGF
ncbi:MAG: SpaA isopeptide-forming pilin-related protein [Anaerolineae bacterium]